MSAPPRRVIQKRTVGAAPRKKRDEDGWLDAQLAIAQGEAPPASRAPAASGSGSAAGPPPRGLRTPSPTAVGGGGGIMEMVSSSSSSSAGPLAQSNRPGSAWGRAGEAAKPRVAKQLVSTGVKAKEKRLPSASGKTAAELLSVPSRPPRVPARRPEYGAGGVGEDDWLDAQMAQAGIKVAPPAAPSVGAGGPPLPTLDESIVEEEEEEGQGSGVRARGAGAPGGPPPAQERGPPKGAEEGGEGARKAGAQGRAASPAPVGGARAGPKPVTVGRAGPKLVGQPVKVKEVERPSAPAPQAEVLIIEDRDEYSDEDFEEYDDVESPRYEPPPPQARAGGTRATAAVSAAPQAPETKPPAAMDPLVAAIMEENRRAQAAAELQMANAMLAPEQQQELARPTTAFKRSGADFTSKIKATSTGGGVPPTEVGRPAPAHAFEAAHDDSARMAESRPVIPVEHRSLANVERAKTVTVAPRRFGTVVVQEGTSAQARPEDADRLGGGAQLPGGSVIHTAEQIVKLQRLAKKWALVRADMKILVEDSGTAVLFDLPPQDQMSLLKRGQWGGATSSKRVQTSDGRSATECQTIAPKQSSKGAQAPDDLRMRELAGQKRVVAIPDTSKMGAFLKGVLRMVESALEENESLSAGAFRDRKTPEAGTTPVVRSGLELHPGALPEFKAKLLLYRPVVAATILTGSRVPQIAVGYGLPDAGKGDVDNEFAALGLVVVWKLGNGLEMDGVLVTQGVPSSLCWGPKGKAHLLFAGTFDGSVCVFDLREPPAEGYSEFSVHFPTYATDGLPFESVDVPANHVDVVKRVAAVAKPLGRAAMDATGGGNQGASVQLISLDALGVMIIWLVVELSPQDARLDDDLSLRAGGRIKLVKTGHLSALGDGDLLGVEAAEISPIDPNQFLLGTNVGSAARGNRFGKASAPRVYLRDDADSGGWLPAACSGCDFMPPHPAVRCSYVPGVTGSIGFFAAGYTDGCVAVFATHLARPLLVFRGVTRGEPVVAVRWCAERPSAIVAIDAGGVLYVLDLLRSTEGPVYVEAGPPRGSRFEGSPVRGMELTRPLGTTVLDLGEPYASISAAAQSPDKAGQAAASSAAAGQGGSPSPRSVVAGGGEAAHEAPDTALFMIAFAQGVLLLQANDSGSPKGSAAAPFAPLSALECDELDELLGELAGLPVPTTAGGQATPALA